MATKIFVITVYPHKLQLSQVKLGKQPQLADFGEAEWNDETLDDVVASIEKDFGVDRVRLLLTEGLDFVVKLEIPKEKEGLREAVAAVVKKKKPEVLAAGDWDFRVTGEKSTFLEVTVFAPEKVVWQKLKRAFKRTKMTIEAVEPEVLAKERDEIAEIGLALKTDLGGWDAQVLNVVPTQVVEEAKEQGEKKKLKEKKRPNSSPRLWIWGVLGMLMALGVVIGGVVVSQRALRARPTPTPAPVVEAAPVATEAGALEVAEASPAATPKAAVDLSEYTVQVLNGSGVSGAASKVGLLLEEEGLEDIDLGNADASTYELTLVSRKEEVEDKVMKAVVGALEETYEVEEADDVLPQESAYDLVVIVGRAK